MYFDYYLSFASKQDADAALKDSNAEYLYFAVDEIGYIEFTQQEDLSVVPTGPYLVNVRHTEEVPALAAMNQHPTVPYRIWG